MNIQEAVKILRKHNEWRRYEGPIGQGPEMVNPTDLGIAIDTICDIVEKMPKWVQVKKGTTFETKYERFFLRTECGYFYVTGFEVPRDGEMLLVSELENLPLASDFDD